MGNTSTVPVPSRANNLKVGADGETAKVASKESCTFAGSKDKEVGFAFVSMIAPPLVEVPYRQGARETGEPVHEEAGSAEVHGNVAAGLDERAHRVG